MARSYAYNPQTVAEGSEPPGGNRITSSGAYVGKFTMAKAIVAKTGTEGVEFAFKSIDGAEVRYLTLYTYDKNGKELQGAKQLSALMACMKVREISATPDMADEWNSMTRKMEPVTVDQYKQLIGVPVGLVLQLEEYMSGDTVKERMNLYSFFNAETRQTGFEVASKIMPPVALNKILEGLKDKRLSSSPGPAATQQTMASFDDGPEAPPGFDDDIPF